MKSTGTANCKEFTKRPTDASIKELRDTVKDRVQLGDQSVSVDTSTGKLDTYLHQKPTDARRYLNFHSFHPRHAFSGITFSQMRRICLLDSDAGKCVEDLKSMKKDFSDVGYMGNLIDGCEIKVHQLDRSEILFNEGPNVSEQDNNMLCFVTNFSFHHKNIQNILQSFSPDLINLIGPMKVVLSARGNPSTRSMLFKQKSFASIAPIPVSDHRCGSCKTCQVISNDTSFDLEGCVVKANKYFTCRSDNVIYLAICRHCRDFYIGQTQNPLKDRVSGHRKCFSQNFIKDSALAIHIDKDHPTFMHEKVNNFYFSVLHKFESGHSLDRMEDSLILRTKAAILHLNRHKVKR